MERLSLNQIREMYLKFFEGKEHLRFPSSSLVPKNDKSILLINAGMTPLKPYFTGIQEPPRRRMTTCQKCIRTGDIENVGITSRHGTFFEMLGNFSFGDYFKKEAIPWAWEFTTEVLKLPKDKLYVTIYLDDDEAYDIWVNSTDIEPDRIFRLGKKDNFWEHGVGPCGPCTEIHFERGEEKATTVEEFEKAADEDRIVEFWNLVFTQFDKDESGNYSKLASPNIDTGMGLERMATIMQGVNSIFEVDAIREILDEVCRLSNKEYDKDYSTDVSIRIVTDHIRSITFMICDGILPSNEGRGYVLRRLLRRAARHGKLLGIEGTFLASMCDKVINNYSGNYPELKEKIDYIKKVVRIEEERFNETIDSGIQILNEYVSELEENKETVLKGEKIFKLYDTYGFPVELTEEILLEKGIKSDLEGFNEEMKNQRERARAARSETNLLGMEDTILNKIPFETITEFDGYNNYELSSIVNLLIKDEEFVSVIEEGSEGVLLVEKTPFYAEMGGQVGDKGIIENEYFKAEVLDCKKNISGRVMHFIKVLKGKVSLDEKVFLSIDKNRRKSIRKNHTATHLLNQALREVLGSHVNQSGSYVDDERLRFDFNHFEAVSEEDLKKIENIINEKIMEVIPVNTQVMTIDEAKESGAIALFDSKYKEEVRVVQVGGFSKELCGGTHVENSGEIGLFRIVSEYGVAAGIRRIEALTGFGALKLVDEKNNLIKEVENVLKCSSKDILHKIENLSLDLKEKEKEITELKGKLAGSSLDEILNSAEEVNGVKLYTGVLQDVDGNSLRDLADKVRDKAVEGVVVLGSVCEDKVNFVAMASKGAVQKGVHCGKIIKEVSAVADGGGGGRPDMAQAGGKSKDKVKDAVLKAQEVLKTLVK